MPLGVRHEICAETSEIPAFPTIPYHSERGALLHRYVSFSPDAVTNRPETSRLVESIIEKRTSRGNMGDRRHGPLRVDFDRQLKLQFQGSTVISDAGRATFH